MFSAHWCRSLGRRCDAAALVEIDARFLEAEAFGEGLAAHGDERHVGIERWSRSPPAAGSIARRERAVILLVDRLDLGAEPELHALLLQDALHLARDFAVEAGQDAVEELDHRDLGAEPRPDRAELEPDDAGADHQQALGHRAERQRAGGGDDLFLVDRRCPAASRGPSRWR